MSFRAGSATCATNEVTTSREPHDRLPVRLWLTAGACLLALVGHFTMTVLFVAPVNPVSLDLHSTVNRYMGPVFQQNWQLFAPNPVNEERGMLVRAKVRTDDGQLIETEFYDFTSPMIAELHSTRIFPARKTRMVSNTLQLLGFRDPIADRLRARADELRIEELAIGGAEVQADDIEPLPLTSAEETIYATAIEVLRAVGSEEAIERWGGGVEEIQVRLVVNTFPRFSDRSSADAVGGLVIQDIEWLEVRS